MPTGNPTHLVTLANRAFRQLTDTRRVPEPSRKLKPFRPIRMNPAKLDESWDRKHGAAVRLTAVLLGESDESLKQRVCEDARSIRVYSAAADWLQRESVYLRKVARLLDTASGRVTTVLGRCAQGGDSPTS